MSIATPITTTVITVIGMTREGDLVEQKFPLRHESGVDEIRLFGQVGSLINNSGGIFSSIDAKTLRFYPISSFKHLDMSAESIILASSPSIREH